MIVLYIILAIVVLLVMVLIHELGHYTAGRLLKVKVNEFSIGFGKALISKKNKRGETISLRLFPLGGYCAFEGEEDEDGKSNPDSFVNQKPWKRIIIYFAGVFFNFISAIIFSFILLVSVGYGNIYTVTFINPNFTNTTSVLEVGDTILEVNGQEIDLVWGKDITTLAGKLEVGDTVKFTIRKTDGTVIEDVEVPVETHIQMELDENGNVVESKNEEGLSYEVTGLGFSAMSGGERLPFFEALGKSFSFTFGLVAMVFEAFWKLITFQISIGDIGGPVTTVSVMAQMASQGIASFLVLLPLIAANLAVFNILPFPALDGSHVIFTTIEWIRGKPINRNVENWIHGIGLIVLLAFVVIVDILHFVL